MGLNFLRFVSFKIIVRLTGGNIAPFALSLAVDNFYIFAGEYSFEIDGFSNFFGDFW